MNIEQRKDLILSMKEKIFAMQKEWQGKLVIEQKASHKDLVTNADKAIEAYLVHTILALFPDDTIVGEEYGEQGKKTSGFIWYLDPIDGTNNFIHGLDEFGTSIGLVHKGQIVFGAIFSADDHKMYWALKGRGAYCEQQKFRCSSTCSQLKDCMMTFGPHLDPIQAQKDLEIMKRVFPQIRGLRDIGSAVINLIRVAQGKYDALWYPFVNPHDFSAGVLLVQEAGGFVSRDDPATPIPPTAGALFATNGRFHELFVKVITHNPQKVLTQEDAVEALKEVIDPELGMDIYTLGLVYKLDVHDNKIDVLMTLTSPMCPYGPVIAGEVKQGLEDLGFAEVNLDFTFEPPWEPNEEVKMMLGLI
ncbi:DUF59 domain-containing protein [Candidatus Woesearchaeota archaeon]|nr:DUF59 domain-containing protein [Candidatus Woesearchaeota archaeon]